MGSERENFDLTGPQQLTNVDWTNNHHLQTVTASLVEGAYHLEYDRQESPRPQVQSSRWWNFFHFQLKLQLRDDKDSSIYGVAYEKEHTLPERAPKYVIAFRGTILKPRTAVRDMKLNIKVLTDELHNDKSRFEHALEAVEEYVQQAGSANVWLAGHSLGSAIAMMVGKSMAQKGVYLKTFLFNPPFLGSSLLKIIDNRYWEDGIRFAKTMFNVGILSLVGGHMRQRQYDQFNELSSWIPNLFVNRHDPICSGYIGQFRNMNKMEKIGDGKMASVSAMHSTRSMLKVAGRKDPQLPIQLLPKANLTISENSSSHNFHEAHGLKQWWYQMPIGPGSANS